MQSVLVTGAAGFIGFHVASRLLARGEHVVGVDNMNSYYDTSLKEARLRILCENPCFTFSRIDIADRGETETLLRGQVFDRIVHLAAQVGVRYSLENPHAYIDSNLVGFLNMLEEARHANVRNLVYASSSSVYGGNEVTPYTVEQPTDSPLNLYAATKKANELMAYSYSHLYALPSTGLRFFTTYGPWGRPDMAVFAFARAILAGETINLHGRGMMRRDFTYVDDVADGIVRALDTVPAPAADSQNKSGSAGATPMARVHNLGGQRSVELTRLVELLEDALGKRASVRLIDSSPGEMQNTHADCSSAENSFGYRAQVPLEEGVRRFVEWYRNFYAVARQ